MYKMEKNMYLWILATFAAYFIKGLCGFANTLVFTSILSFGTSNANISPIELLIGYPTNFILTWKNRKELDPKVYLPLAGLVLAGSIPGALFLKNVDVGSAKILFGIIVILLGIEMLFRKKRPSGNSKGDSANLENTSRIMLGMVGLLAGVLCGLFGVGALLAAYIDRVTEGGSSFKANISAVFIADNTFRIILYSALHLLTFNTLRSALALIPIALLGLYAGMKRSQIVNETAVRKLMIVLLILSGILLIEQNV